MNYNERQELDKPKVSVIIAKLYKYKVNDFSSLIFGMRYMALLLLNDVFPIRNWKDSNYNISTII